MCFQLSCPAVSRWGSFLLIYDLDYDCDKSLLEKRSHRNSIACTLVLSCLTRRHLSNLRYRVKQWNYTIEVVSFSLKPFCVFLGGVRLLFSGLGRSWLVGGSVSWVPLFKISFAAVCSASNEGEALSSSRFPLIFCPRHHIFNRRAGVWQWSRFLCTIV